jgi:hypothetical protein
MKCKECDHFSKEQNWTCDDHYCNNIDERKIHYNVKYKNNLYHLHFDAPSAGVKPYQRACDLFCDEKSKDVLRLNKMLNIKNRINKQIKNEYIINTK